ncbi:MAG TPA: hypothetical protein VLX58_19960, partial [Bryobacteraceae bacterium]|nr:hypothetical protein [Bryobacteraceae bacterium]
MSLKTLFALPIVAALCFTLTAADEKKPETRKSAGGPLQPAMTPEGGWEKTMGNLGEKPSEPWTSTTIAAGVDKKPLPGKVVTVTGEIIDLSCYLQLGKHGEKHKSCGQKCLSAGQPIGLLTKEGNIYMLMEEEHDPRRDGQTDLRTAAGEHFAHVMEVSGTETSVRGIHAIYVQGFLKK